jgi:hypothetical protein
MKNVTAAGLTAEFQAAFDGQTIEKGDGPRLWTQLRAVEDLMKDGQWRTLFTIRHRIALPHYRVSASEAGISARLRDLRKERFGAYQVERKRTGALYAYRVLPPLPTGQLEMKL